MQVPTWAWAAGAAALGIGGAALVAAKSAGASSPAPPATTPATPIQIVQGHRYQVTLTFGGPTTAAALLASVVPNLQVGLNSVAPNEFSLVHAIAPSNSQVVYVVDAIGGAPGSSLLESPQTFYADLNAASMGGIGVQVQDLGATPPGAPVTVAAPQPTPGQPPVGGAAPPAQTPTGNPALPPASLGPSASPTPPTSTGALTLTSLVTDPALVTYGQTALATLESSGVLKGAGGPLTPNGSPGDPLTLAAVVALQALQPLLPRSSQLDFATWAAAVTLAELEIASHSGTPLAATQTVADASLVTLAQTSLATAIGYGQIPHVDYGAAQANGDATDAAWKAALIAALTPYNAGAGGASVYPVDGTLNYPSLALLLSSSIAPPQGNGAVPVTPATPVAGGAISWGLQYLSELPAFAGFSTLPTAVNSGNPADPQNQSAIAAFQATVHGLQHRTTSGVLDYLTFASIVSAWLSASTAGSSPAKLLTGPQVTTKNEIAGLQEALVVLVGQTKMAGVVYSATPDGNATGSDFTKALSQMVAAINAKTSPSGYTLATSGPVDWFQFSSIFALAYL